MHRPPCLPSLLPSDLCLPLPHPRTLAADLRVVVLAADLELDRAEVQQVRVDAALVQRLEVERLHVPAELTFDAVFVEHRVRVAQVALLDTGLPADVPEQLVDAVHRCHLPGYPADATPRTSLSGLCR